MCGIFGAIGKNINPGTIRALGLINRERGTDSMGFFDNTGKFVKRAADPVACLGDNDFADFIDNACCRGWFLAGHTRYATHGTVTTRNAHPFRYGRIIGCHNGIVQTPHNAKYRVDSEYLFDSLNSAKGDYHSAFADISGYWGLSWFDGESFYLQAHDNEVAIGRDARGVWYYSSDWRHLEAAVRITDNFTLISNGETIRFAVNSDTYERCRPFNPVARQTTLFPVVTKNRKRRKAKRGGNDFAERAANTDPFYFDEDERWGGVDNWGEYVRDFL